MRYNAEYSCETQPNFLWHISPPSSRLMKKQIKEPEFLSFLAPYSCCFLVQTLKIEAICSYEMLLTFTPLHALTSQNIRISLHIQHCENVKSNRVLFLLFLRFSSKLFYPKYICRITLEISVGRHVIVHEISIKVSRFCPKLRCFDKLS